jgi:hypothetical protein
MRRSVKLEALGVLASALLAAPSVLAQASTAPGDPGDASPFAGFLLSAPLRLSLEGSIFPVARAFPNCLSREDDAGNSVGGIPVQHYSEVRVTPRLVLSGFSQLGCSIDAGLGAVFTYTVPIRESTSFVLGGGLYGAPGQGSLFGGLPTSLSGAWRGGDSPVQMAGRVDMVWDTKDGHPYNIGVQSFGRGRQQVTFGGGF